MSRSINPSVSVFGRKSAFKIRVNTYALENNLHDNLTDFFEDAKVLFIKETKKLLNSFPIIKLNASLEALFQKVILDDFGDDDDDDNEQFERHDYTTFYIQTKNRVIDGSTDISMFFTEHIQNKMISQLSEVELQGSGWSLYNIKALVINNNKHEVFSGANYIDLPDFIANKKAVINVQNKDNECFKWAVLAALHPKDKNAHRVSNYYPFRNELNFENITFPVTLNQLKTFEKQNENISINVYAIDEEYSPNLLRREKVIVPIRIAENYQPNHIHLLWISNEDTMKQSETETIESEPSLVNMANNIEVVSHYCYIKNLPKLIVSQSNSHEHRIWICDRCLHYFHSELKLTKHTIDCENKNKCKITLPTRNSMQRWISFKNYNRQLPVPFIIYADIESLLQPTNNENKIPKGAYQQHTAICVGYYLHCLYDSNQSIYKTFSGSDCINWFLKELYEISMQVVTKIRNITEMMLNENELRQFNEAITCHICNEKFDDLDTKVRDHSHLTGTFRGAAHSQCNLKYQEARVLPIVFHNLNYDSHFLITKLSSAFEGKINCIPVNSEHYISFTKEVGGSIIGKNWKEIMKIRFIDSFKFLPHSLQKLASFLPVEKLIITKNEWKNLSPEKFRLLCRKGVYPYDFMDSANKLKETKLPPREAFYNKLNDEHITDEEYDHAQRIWDEFEIKNMLDYTNIYLKTDVLLLADIFENFRKSSLHLYGLDPAHYLTSPALSWDAMLKYTKVRLEALTDIDMLLFVEKGLRGGISQCSHRYSKANNKYLDDYDSNKPTNFLIYFDVNNLYGWAMMECLPRSNFEWVVMSISEILQTPDDAKHGYLIEVDLEYPTELHDQHNDYPLCAEHMIPPNSESKQTKLILNLHDKNKYVLHYRTLKLVLQNGMRLKQVWRILKFRQSNWLRPYILLNTNERTKATNEFEKNFFKLMSNAVYGKTLENVRERVDVRLRNKWLGRYGARNLIIKPNFKKRVIFNEDLIAIEMTRTNIFISKPIIVGVCVLEISKLFMYDFHYDFMLKKFNTIDCRLQYTDTDSFIYDIQCGDIYAFIKDNSNKFDTSDYSPNNRYGIKLVNNKIPGKMKDECKGYCISEFIGLRSKMYSVKIAGLKTIKKAKGVKYNVMERKIRFHHFLKCLKEKCDFLGEQCTIKSKLHQVYSIKQTKKMLDSDDNKRYILENRIDTFAWGHYLLP